MRQRRDPFRELDAFSAVRSWVDCTTNMSGFDLRQAQGVWQRKPSVRILAHLPAVQDSFSAAAGTSAAQSGNNAPALPRLGGAELIYAAPNYSLGAGGIFSRRRRGGLGSGAPELRRCRTVSGPKLGAL